MIPNIKQKQKEQKIYVPPRPCFLVASSKDCLQIDKNRINFCKYPIFGSSFKQITINIQLLDVFAQQQKKQFHLLKINTLQNLGLNHQQIFTFKFVQNGQEQTQMEIPIKAGQPLQIHIRANIPELQVSTDISGFLNLQIDQFEPYTLPIVSRGQVPQIVCLKQMLNIKTGLKIIKIPSKNIMKIPFKNCSNINFFFEVKLIGKDQQNPDSDGVKLRIVPNQPPPKFDQQKDKLKQNLIMKVDANSTFCVTLQFELLKKDNAIRIARRILILQVQGTKLFFPFPLQVIISE